MGGLLSKDDYLSKQQRQALIASSNPGVLVPPSLLDPLPLLSRALALFHLQETPLACDVIVPLSPGQRLLREYLQPGIWVAGSSTNGKSQVLATFNYVNQNQLLLWNLPNDNGSIAAVGDGMLYLSHSLLSNTELHLLAPTHGVPSITVVQNIPPLSAQWRANLNANGRGWMGGLFEANIGHPQHSLSSELASQKIILGSGVAFQLPMNLSSSDAVSWTNDEMAEPYNKNNNNNGSPTMFTSVYGLGGLDINGMLLAVTADARIQTDPTTRPTIYQIQPVRSFFHTNLNLDEQSSPLWLTARAQLHPVALGDFSVQICQSLTFDRYVWNILEDRAPFIRNHLTWTVEMSQTNHNKKIPARMHHRSGTTTAGTSRTILNTNDDDDDDTFSTLSNNNNHVLTTNTDTTVIPTQLTAGVAWQFNRNVAIKAVTSPSEGNIRGAVIFQRWKQPRLTCSVIGEYNMWNRQGQFVGVGLELGSSGGTYDRSASALPSPFGSPPYYHTDGKTTSDRFLAIKATPETSVVHSV